MESFLALVEKAKAALALVVAVYTALVAGDWLNVIGYTQALLKFLGVM